MTSWHYELTTRNAQTAADWARYAPHRRQVTELLLNSAPARGRLAVLGAGNCNDLDLESLVAGYAQVHLVDWDAEALAQGVARQTVDQQGLTLYGGVDLAGLPQPDASSLPLEQAETLPSQLDAWPDPDLPAPFDCVASVCLLSQMIEQASRLVGEQTPGPLLEQVIVALRVRHLRLLLELLKPGGTAWLITDVVSSATAPNLKWVNLADLPTLLQMLMAQENVFFGLHPARIQQTLATDARLQPLVEQRKWSQPWKWECGGRTYAVLALRLTRSGDNA